MAYDAEHGEIVAFGGCRAWKPVEATATFEDRTTSDDPTTGAKRILKHHCQIAPGSTPNASMSNETWTWSNGQWQKESPLGPIPHPRWFATLAWDKVTEKVLLFGGLYQGAESTPPAGSVPCWDRKELLKQLPGTNDAGGRMFAWTSSSRWSATKTDWPRLSKITGVKVGTQPLYSYCFNDTWLWDGSRWENMTPANPAPGTWPGPRYDASMAGAITPDDLGPDLDGDGEPEGGTDPDGRVVLFGGCNGLGLWGSHYVVDQPYYWDCTNFPGLITSIFLRNGTPTELKQEPCHHYRDDCEQYTNIGDLWSWDGTTWRLDCPKDCPRARGAAGALYLKTEKCAKDGTVMVDQFGQSTCAPFRRMGAMLAYAPGAAGTPGTYVLYGGYQFNPQWAYGSNGVGDTWEWRAKGSCEEDVAAGTAPDTRPAPCWQLVMATWKHDNWATPSALPTNRAWGQMTSLLSGQAWRAVLFGGGDPNSRDDTWVWQDGTTGACTDGFDIYDKTCWQPCSTCLTVKPPPRQGAGFAFTTHEGVAVLYGGICTCDDFYTYYDTWTLIPPPPTG